jgi:hypothetical protein
MMTASMNKDPHTTADAAEADAIPRAKAAMAVPGNQAAEGKPLPKGVQKRSPEQKSPAEWAYERLILYIQNFEEQLDGDHEVAMGFTGGDVGNLHIHGMGFFAPDLLAFYGADEAGTRAQLIQHVSQLNVMLRAAKKQHKEPTRIGFKLASTLDEETT